MSYKNILVYLDQGVSNTERVKTSIDMAVAYGARLTGVVVTALPNRSVLQRLGQDRGEKLIEQTRAETEATFKEFEAAVADKKVTADTRAIEGRESEVSEKLARFARNFDICILRQANPDRPNAEFIAELSEEVLFASGRPVFFMPYIGAHSIPCRKGVIAWDGSAAATRAVHDALPLLESMDEVSILVVDPGEMEKEGEVRPGEDLSFHLSTHGVKNRVSRAYSGGTPTSSIILNHVFETDADMLVMGGYGTPKLREIILGGVTRTLLSSMTVPVLMSH